MSDNGSGYHYDNRDDRPRYGRSGTRAGRRGSGGRMGSSRPRGRFDERGSREERNSGRRRSGPPQRKACPPELRDAFMEARDFLAGLIAALGLPARLSFGGVEPARDGRQITIDVRGLRNQASPDRYGRNNGESVDDLAILIGKHGAMLDALTAITNAMMHRGESEGLFFAVDVEGYRSRRIATLRSIAQRSAERALRDGVAVELAPMPPSERRIVHMTLASHPDLATESTGIGSNRRVVIVPRDLEASPPEDGAEDEPDY
jgi:predicted RNA-binding protein Jag